MDLRRISQSSTDKLARLKRDSGRWRLFSWANHQAEMIAELGNAREPALIPYLAPHTLSDNAVIRHSARIAVSKLLGAVPIARLMEFDAFTRASGDGWRFSPGTWVELSPAAVGKFSKDHDIAVLAFASMHYNGRVRESALRVLAKREDGRELAFLLLRANDWVEPVRTQVRAWIAERIRPDYAPHFLRYLPLVLQLERCGRAQHGWLIEAVGELLARSECRSVLQEGLASQERDIRRACLRFIDVTGATTARTALFAALSDPDPVIRLWAARRLLSTVKNEERSGLYGSLETDSFMPIRREVLYARIHHQDEQLPLTLQAALLDRHSSMRELARFHLKNHFDAAKFYREIIPVAEGSKLVVAIRGLGECGSAADTDAIASFYESRRVRIREACIFSIGRLAPSRFEETLMRALADDSPRVSAEACTALYPIVSAIGVRRISAFLTPDFAPFVRKNTLRLIPRLSKWEQIPLLLAACRDPFEKVSLVAVAGVRMWLGRYNRSFTTPSPAQIAEAGRELRHSQEFLNSYAVNELGALFKQWMK